MASTIPLCTEGRKFCGMDPQNYRPSVQRGIDAVLALEDRKSTRLNSSHLGNSYAVSCLKKKRQAYSTGLRFIQFYFGLPLAMIILSLTVVPFFHSAKVYTAYEYLERRFDVGTRTLTSLR